MSNVVATTDVGIRCFSKAKESLFYHADSFGKRPIPGSIASEASTFSTMLSMYLEIENK